MGEESMLAVSFGEILYDQFEDGDYLGGAPLNFAWYLRQFGVPLAMISAVGNDALGTAAVDVLSKAGIRHDWVARRPERTGTAGVSLVNDQPIFAFSDNSAWDYISLPEDALQGGSLLYFGTLSQRSAENRASLQRLVQAPFLHRFFDVNLRVGHYSDAIIIHGMENASIVKMNQEEWNIIERVIDVDRPCDAISRYELTAIVITKGAEGAELHTPGHVHSSRSPSVRQVDSVGAGDAFCAVMAAAAVLEVPLRSALPVACEAGAFVASRRGAQVELDSRIRNSLR